MCALLALERQPSAANAGHERQSLNGMEVVGCGAVANSCSGSLDRTVRGVTDSDLLLPLRALAPAIAAKRSPASTSGAVVETGRVTLNGYKAPSSSGATAVPDTNDEHMLAHVRAANNRLRQIGAACSTPDSLSGVGGDATSPRSSDVWLQGAHAQFASRSQASLTSQAKSAAAAASPPPQQLPLALPSLVACPVLQAVPGPRASDRQGPTAPNALTSLQPRRNSLQESRPCRAVPNPAGQMQQGQACVQSLPPQERAHSKRNGMLPLALPSATPAAAPSRQQTCSPCGTDAAFAAKALPAIASGAGAARAGGEADAAVGQGAAAGRPAAAVRLPSLSLAANTLCVASTCVPLPSASCAAGKSLPPGPARGRCGLVSLCAEPATLAVAARAVGSTAA